MLSVEERTMINTNQITARDRVIQASFLIGALALSCKGTETAPQPQRGRLEIVADASYAAADCPHVGNALTGQLELRGVNAGAASLVSIAGVSPGSKLQKELPPGLYSMTWTSDARAPLGAPLPRTAPLVVVYADRLTRLIVHEELTESAASALDDGAIVPGCRS